MRLPGCAAVIAVVVGSGALAKLPPLSDDAKAQAAESTNKSVWADRVALYKLCQSMDHIAATYRAHVHAVGKVASEAEQTPPCVDPGPYVPHVTPSTSKPLEAAGAHSPPGPAATPPSKKDTSAEQAGSRR